MGLRNQRLKTAAIAGALLLHAVVLGSMGLVRPEAEEPAYPPAPTVEITLLPSSSLGRPESLLQPRLALSPDQRAPPPSPLRGLAVPPPSLAPPEPPRVAEASKDFPGFYEGGLPGCGREDLPLLTREERLRCTEQIAAEAARRADREADETARRTVEAARAAPRIDAIAPERRSAFDAVQARRAARTDFRAAGNLGKDHIGGKVTGIDVGVRAGCTLSFGGKLTCPNGAPKSTYAAP